MTKQYEPCEHRPEIRVGGVLIDSHDTPCPTCAALEAQTKYDAVVVKRIAIAAACVLAIALLVAWRFA